MNKLLLLIGAATMLVLEGAARMPASSFDSNPAALDTCIGTVGLSVDQTIDTRTGSLDASVPGKLNTTKAGTCLIFF